MSFATIVSEIGAGRYEVEMDFGEAPRDATVTNIDAYVAQLQATRAELDGELTELTEKIETQRQVLRDAVTVYVGLSQQGENPSPDALIFERTKLIGMNTEAARYRVRIQMIDGEIRTLTKKKNKLTDLAVIQRRLAWCVTYTTGASGEVATIDIPGDDRLVLIAPNARAWNSGDGLLFARELCDPNQAFWNAAILAGWQSESPTYRYGQITRIDYEANTCSVTLGEATMTGQRLDVNVVGRHDNVPVDYMTCDARAFQVGDNVVIRYLDRKWLTPVVIGFVTDPRRCQLLRSHVYPGYFDGIQDVENLRPGDTIPGAVAALPPPDWPPVGMANHYATLIGWHIEWTHQSGTPAALRQAVQARTLPETTWDAETYPYDFRSASAMYAFVWDLWISAEDIPSLGLYDGYEYQYATVRRQFYSGDLWDAWVTAYWDVTPRTFFIDASNQSPGGITYFPDLDQATITERAGRERYYGRVLETTTDEQIIAAADPENDSRARPSITWNVEYPSITHTFSGTTSYGLAYQYEVTWETPYQTEYLLITTVDPETV